MVNIGKFNKIKIIKSSQYGLFLDGEDLGEILLPKRFSPKDFELGQELEVFVSYDSEDRLVATTDAPKAQVGEFASLEVVEINDVGAFLDWGLAKDLFLPFSEQTRDLRIGEMVLVFVYLDKSQRIAASMRLEKHLIKTSGSYQPMQEVQLIIMGKTDLGYKAIVNEKHLGVLYANEVFKSLPQGLRTKGYVKKVREDGKLDLILENVGYKAADEIGDKILKLLKSKGGFIAISEKTQPEEIYRLFGVSKKKFKIALGGLYKKRIVSISDQGIKLVSKSESDFDFDEIE